MSIISLNLGGNEVVFNKENIALFRLADKTQGMVTLSILMINGMAMEYQFSKREDAQKVYEEIKHLLNVKEISLPIRPDSSKLH